MSELKEPTQLTLQNKSMNERVRVIEDIINKERKTNEFDWIKPIRPKIVVGKDIDLETNRPTVRLIYTSLK